MKVIIFAGGYGKRLWPLSRKDTPKQFQKLFGDQTSLENSFETISLKFKTEDIYISTGEMYAGQIKDVIPNFPNENIIIEPESRDTTAAVAYAMAKISEKFPNEPVLIRWQNSLIKAPKKFAKALRDAEELFENGEANLVYLGVPSRYPNTTVGHIKLGGLVTKLNNGNVVYGFSGFAEKPNKELAEKYHNSGKYLWNPGCYITTPKYILSKLKEHSPEIYLPIEEIMESFGKKNEWEVTKKEFKKIPKISIDYALWEKLSGDDIKVISSEYDWHYISTWADLKNALKSGTNLKNIEKGNVIELDTDNCLIYNFGDKKIIAAVGVSGINVIDTGDAILIVSDERAGDVKKILDKLEEQGKENYL
ncbi:MAG: sugar phosphate nucleotidyltransferase [Candidatus Dojkabacteria bacterium]